jgi:hypothetical protein
VLHYLTRSDTRPRIPGYHCSDGDDSADGNSARVLSGALDQNATLDGLLSGFFNLYAHRFYPHRETVELGRPGFTQRERTGDGEDAMEGSAFVYFYSGVRIA